MHTVRKLGVPFYPNIGLNIYFGFVFADQDVFSGSIIMNDVRATIDMIEIHFLALLGPRKAFSKKRNMLSCGRAVRNTWVSFGTGRSRSCPSSRNGPANPGNVPGR